MNDLIKNDLAFDLYAEWEERQVNGDPISLELICVDHPEIYPEVVCIAKKIHELGLSPVSPASLTDTLISSTSTLLTSESSTIRREDWVEIGRGASSVVYRGYDPDFGTVVAYKVLHPNQLVSPSEFVRLLKRFEQEAHILARLKHEGIVRIFKTFSDQGRPVLEMEFLEGGSLQDFASELRTQGVIGIARFMTRVARAVGFAHQNGIVHRDLKPTNILLDRSSLPCVSDFGIAKLLQKDRPDESLETGPIPERETDDELMLTNPNRQPGTKAYMAPEQFNPSIGGVCPATDVWAIGVILFELLYGSRPFQGNTWSDWKATVCEKPIVFPSIRKGRIGNRLVEIIRRCLIREPNDRYSSGTELADDLANINRPTLLKRLQLPTLMILLVLGTMIGMGLNNGTSPKTPSLEETNLHPTVPKWVDIDQDSKNRKQLAEGKMVTLIGNGRPIAYRAVMGDPKVTIEDQIVSIESDECGLVEFLSELPSEKPFLVQCQLKHAYATNVNSSVGLFAWGSGRWGKETGSYICGVIDHSNWGRSRGMTQARIFRFDYIPTERRFDVFTYRVPGTTKRIAQEDPWREFDLDLDPQSIGTNRLPVGPISLETFRSYAKESTEPIDNAGSIRIREAIPIQKPGALGVFVKSGKVFVRNFHIEPKNPVQRPK